MENGVDESEEKSKENYTWASNHEIITNAFLTLVEKNKRRPTYLQLAKETLLNVGTIKKHIDKLEFRPTKHPFRMLTDNVLLAIYHAAMAGKPQSQKLWLQVLENFQEKNIVELPAFEKIGTLIIETVSRTTKKLTEPIPDKGCE